MHSFFKTMFCLFLISTASIIACSEKPKKLSPYDAQKLLAMKKNQEFIEAAKSKIKEQHKQHREAEEQRQNKWCAQLRSQNSQAALYDSEEFNDNTELDSDSDDEITGFFRPVDPLVFAQP